MVAGAVEGLLDEAVLTRLIRHAGAIPGPVHGRQGKAHLQRTLRGYNAAARFSPWLVLIDLDHDAECPPPAVGAWLPNPAPHMCLRIAVRTIEAWLLADRHRIARFLGVAPGRVPAQPETLGDPKRAVVDLARGSRRREIREDRVPRRGSGRAVGSAYASRLIEFVHDASTGWRPEVAAGTAPSLARCIRALARVVGDLRLPKG